MKTWNVAVFGVWLAVSTAAFGADSKELTRLLQGPLTPDVIKDVIHEQRAKVRRCAEARPAAKQSTGGKVVVHFIIGLTGTLSDVRVASSTLSEPALEKCLTDAVKTFRFPKPKKGPVEVNFPFRVGPPGKEAPSKAAPPPSPKRPADEDPDLLD